MLSPWHILGHFWATLGLLVIVNARSNNRFDVYFSLFTPRGYFLTYVCGGSLGALLGGFLESLKLHFGSLGHPALPLSLVTLLGPFWNLPGPILGPAVVFLGLSSSAYLCSGWPL